MYEEYDDDYRNYYEEDDDDVRNARRRRPRRRPRWAPAPYPQAPVVMAPWEPAPAPKAPIVDRWGGLKLGLIADAAAQVLGAMTPLPNAPVASGTVAADLAAIMEYQRKLAEHAKRDEQIRTAGALARLFLA